MAQSKSEVKDLSEAFRKLSEANALPLFMASSSMMLTPVLNISTDDTSGLLANRIQILEKSLDTLMDESKNNTQLIIDRFDNTASSRIDTHKEEQVGSDDNVEANNGTKKTYAKLMEVSLVWWRQWKSCVIKNKGTGDLTSHYMELPMMRTVLR